MSSCRRDQPSDLDDFDGDGGDDVDGDGGVGEASLTLITMDEMEKKD